MPELFDEILHDLELKRAAALDRAEAVRRLDRRRDAVSPTLRVVASTAREADAMPSSSAALVADAARDARRWPGGDDGDRPAQSRHRRARRRAASPSASRAAPPTVARADDLRPLGARRGGADRAAGTSTSRRRSCCSRAACRDARPSTPPTRRASSAAPARSSPWNEREDRGRGPQGVPLARRWTPRRPPRSRRAGRASARTRSAARTSRSRRCRTSSRRSSCSPATCGSPSATSSTAPSARCCARDRSAERPERQPSRSRCSRPTAARSSGRRRPARADRVRDDRASTSARRDETRARAAALAARPGSPAPTCRGSIVLNAKTLIERDADFSRFAGRILLTYIYEEALGWDIVRDGIGALRAAHRRGVPAAAASAASRSGASTRGCSSYDLDRLAAALDPTADLDFDFLGIQTLYDRYLLVDKTGAAPRAARDAAALLDARRDGRLPRRDEAIASARALDLYRLYRSRRFCSSTPTLFNAGTLHSQLSSCYLYNVDDSLESIMLRGIAENAMCSKWAGGLGGSWTAVRGTGSHIERHQRREPGRHPVPQAAQRPARRRQPGRQARRLRLRLPRDLAQRHPRLPRAAPQHRRRAPPHARHEHGELDSRPVHEARRGARALDALPLLNDVPDLHELYGRAFEQRYVELRGARRPRARSARRADRRARALEADARDALRDRPSVDHVQGPVQRPQPAGPRRRHPLEQPLHRDHAQHERRRDRRLQPRLDRPRPAPDRRRRARPRRSCARPSGSRCARSTT